MDWKRALELAVGGKPLNDGLGLLVRAAAEQWSGKAAIFIVDEAGARLRLGMVEGLPGDDRNVIDPFQIGPDSTPCGIAVHTGERVVVQDIAREPLWEPYRAFAQAQGIRSCWSTPIRSRQSEVLGVLAVYHAEPRKPGPGDFEAMDLLARTACLMIEHHISIVERQDSETLLSSVLHHLPVGVAVYDMQGRVTRINAAMRRFTMDVLPSIDEHNGARWRGGWPDGRPVERHDFPGARALRGETVVPGTDFRFCQDDGVELWTRVSAAPLRDAAGRVTGAVAVVTDIDAEKRAEYELRGALAEARRSELVAHEMSHRIMNSFQLLHSVLSMQTQSIADPQARQVVQQAFDRVQAMAVVQRRLFESTRQNLEVLDVGDYLRGLVDRLAVAFADGRRCTITADVPVGVAMPTERASSLGLIATELTLNALKHAFRDTEQATLTIRFERVGDTGRLTVADNGAGLPEGQDLRNSAGMGMKLVDGLLRQLGGTLEAERAQPGARFTVTFPMQP